MFKYMIAAAAALFITSGSALACQDVNAAGEPGWVNVREYPSLYAPVIRRWNNPSNGSDWGSGKWCGEEVWDGTEGGRVWSKIYLEMYDGSTVIGWVSDKVLQFLD